MCNRNLAWRCGLLFSPTVTARTTLFRYDVKSKAVKQLVENHGLDFKTLAGGRGGTLAYEQFGTIHLYDVTTGAEHEVKITLDGDFPALRCSRTVAKIGIGDEFITPASLRPACARCS